ncbi:MAG: hypothetical protein ACXWN4_03600, partial [Candidatus Limnocylindrales bacterium]
MAGSSIQGVVTEAGTGVHLSGIWVEADSTTAANYYGGTTLSDGSYTLTGLPADTYVVFFGDFAGVHFNGFYGGGGGVPVTYSAALILAITSTSMTGINAQMAVIGPWSVTIQATATSLAVGAPVTITATTNHDIALTNYDTFILREDGTGWECYEGTTCFVNDTVSAPRSRTYHAVVAEPGGSNIQAESSTVGVTWTGTAIGNTYHPIAPARVLDTRNGTGGLFGPFGNHAARTFTVAGASSGVPANATAVTGNLTVTGQTSNGYLFIGPIATNNPTSSTLNFPVRDDRANAVTVALGAGGTLSITYVAPTTGPTAQVIFDVTGYFTLDTTGATYVPIIPTRALDTRNGTGLASPFTNHVARTFAIAGLPADAVAVTGNLTVTGQTSSGYFSIGPVATNNPGSSTLNFPVGDDRANGVTVALGAGGTLSITFVAPSNGPTAHAIFDVTGYFEAGTLGDFYIPLTPSRALDTRNGTGGLAGPFTNHAARTFTVGGVPAGAIAVSGNLTVTGQTSSGYF